MRLARLLVAGAAVATLASCSSAGDDAAPPSITGGTEAVSTSSTEGTTTTTVARPDGPVAEIGAELSGGAGVNIASAAPAAPVLDAAGYEEHEFPASGTASSYTATGEVGSDGRWTFAEGDSAPYATRILVRRPADMADFSGTVLVEWLDVSGGLDADPDWQMLHEEISRHGDIWVGVSAQLIGIDGGPVAVSVPDAEAAGAGRGIRNLDPARYGELDHPGDGFSFDMFTQVARAVRAGGDVLGGVTPDRVLAVGESQSAFALVTYVNGVQPLTHAFDGFLVHSRGAAGLPFTTAAGQAAGIADSIGNTSTILRTDTDVPIMEIQTESDVAGILNSQAARQDDTDTFRLWEVAGTAHADTRLVGDRAGSLGCGAINDGPMHVVAKAALRALEAWVADGTLPPEAPRLELGADGKVARDGDGIAVGGIRTPPVDVPVDVLSGEADPGAAIICILSGTTTPLAADVVAQRYGTPDAYLQQFERSADEAIDAGFVNPEDRDALLAYAQPDRITG